MEDWKTELKACLLMALIGAVVLGTIFGGSVLLVWLVNW